MHAYETMASESSLEMGGMQQAVLSIELYLKVEQKIVVCVLQFYLICLG